MQPCVEFVRGSPILETRAGFGKVELRPNGDGKLTSTDARWGEFMVLVTKADGSTEVKTLTELGITEINLNTHATQVVLPDGSTIIVRNKTE